MIRTLAIAVTILAGFSLKAQNAYSLQQCIEYALTNHNSVKNAELDVKSSKAKVGETRAVGLPQISGKWDLIHNLDVQQQFFPNEPGPFFNPTIPAGESFPVQFGTNNSSNMSVTATQLIFDGSYIIGLKAAKTYKDLFISTVSKTKKQVTSDVSKAYYMVLITNERVKQVEENEKLLDQLLKDTEILKETGLAEALDVKRTTVNLNNLKVEIQKLKSLKSLTVSLLKFQMGLPQSESLDLTDKLETIKIEAPASGGTSFEGNADYQLLGIQKDLNTLNLKNEKIRILPSLAAFYNGGINYGSNNFGDNFNFGDYTRYQMVGLKLNVPIFSSGQRKFRIDQAKIELTKTENNLSFLEQSLDMQYKQYSNNLKDQLDVLKIREENKQLAQEVYNSAKLKYDEGMASNFEVLTAQTDLKTAQADYYNALYDAMVSKIELDLILGN